MISQTFGDLLICATSDSLKDFPSPESLKKRIVVSTKHPKEYLETKSSKAEDDGSVKVDKSKEEKAWGREISDIDLKIDSDCVDNDDVDDDHHDENQSFQQNAPTEYKQMIGIRAEKMKGGIKVWLKANSEKAHRVSLNEEKLENAVLTHGTEIVR